MYDATLYLINSVMTVLLRFNLRKISKETTRKGITSACRVDHLFEGVRWSAKEGTIGAKEQSSIASLFDHDILQSHIEQVAYTCDDAGAVRILANLFFTHQEHINALDDL